MGQGTHRHRSSVAYLVRDIQAVAHRGGYVYPKLGLGMSRAGQEQHQEGEGTESYELLHELSAV